MSSAVILCNGEFPRKEYPRYLLRNADVLICCDSARNVERLRKLGLEPTLLVGDMDSTPKSVLKRLGWESEGGSVSAGSCRIVRISEQDDNDLAKAFALLRKRYPEATDIHILGAGGKNEAHTVGNLGWLLEWERRSLEETGRGLAARGINVDMVSDWSTAFAVSPAIAVGQAAAPDPDRGSAAHPPHLRCVPPSNDVEGGTPLGGSTCPDSAPSGTVPPQGQESGYGRGCHGPQGQHLPVELCVGEGRRISFFATDNTLRVTSQGLQWPLDGVDLSRWWAATLNRATSDTVVLRFNHPAPLLVILD